MTEQFKTQINDISRRINDIECYVLGVYRDVRILERSDEDLSTHDAIRMLNMRKLCLRLLQELCDF